MTIIEFWNADKGQWQKAGGALTWDECQRLNEIAGKQLYRQTEALEVFA